MRGTTGGRARAAVVAALASAVVALGLSVAPAASGGAPLTVHTVNYPLAYLARRIGGDRVEVSFPAPDGVDPATWTPSPELIRRYQGADLVLLNGADYARWIRLATLRRSRLVNTARGFEDRWLRVEHGVTHSHGPGGEHAHAGWAFTTWLDPRLAIEQARAIAAALERARPDDADGFRQGLSALVADLEALDADLEAATAAIGERPVYFSHPVYQYFQRRYGLNGRSVHWEPAEVPPEDAWAALARSLAEHPARWMLWEGEPAAETARRLRELGVEPVVFDPCGNRPSKGDLLTVMRANLERLRAATGDVPAAPAPAP